MIVNENRLKEFLSNAIIDCESCPLYKPLNDYALCDKYNELTNPNTLPADCSKGILAWLQEMDVIEALQPIYGTPCEVRNERGKESMDCDECDYCFNCPYA